MKRIALTCFLLFPIFLWPAGEIQAQAIPGIGLPETDSAAGTETETGDATEETLAAEGAGVGASKSSADHASPRAVLYAFLVAFDQTKQPEGKVDFSRAVACLDLSDTPRSLRGQEGPKRAVELKDILDRTRRIDFQEVPDQPEGPPYVVLRRAEGEVVIEPDASGKWQFSKETVSNLPLLWRATADLGLVKGVTQAPRTLPLWVRSKVPASWQKVHFLLESWQWLGLVLALFLGLIISRLVVTVFRKFIWGLVRRRLPETEERFLDRASRPLAITSMTAVWWLGLAPLDLPLNVLTVLHHGIWLVAIVAIVWLAYRLVDVFSTLMKTRAAETSSGFDDLLVPLIRKTLKVFVTLFGIAFIADNLDIEISSLLAGLGLGGLAMALAAQDTVKNLFGSLTVLLDRPFEIGDSVAIEGVEGSIEEVGIRSTRIRTFENSLVTLPNSNLISAAVDNKGARVYRRWKTVLGFTYDSPPEKLDAFCEGVRELVRQHPHTRKDAIYVYVNGLGASSLDVLLYLFFDTREWQTELESKHQLALAFLHLAKELELEFAFPTQTLHVHKEPDQEAEESGQKQLVDPDAATDLLEESRQIAQKLARDQGF